MLNKTHTQILAAIKSGMSLTWMAATGNCFEDGFIISGSNNNLTGFGEVLTSDVIFLERNGYLMLNRFNNYVVTNKFKEAI